MSVCLSESVFMEVGTTLLSPYGFWGLSQVVLLGNLLSRLASPQRVGFSKEDFYHTHCYFLPKQCHFFIAAFLRLCTAQAAPWTSATCTNALPRAWTTRGTCSASAWKPLKGRLPRDWFLTAENNEISMRTTELDQHCWAQVYFWVIISDRVTPSPTHTLCLIYLVLGKSDTKCEAKIWEIFWSEYCIFFIIF